ncbi:MAG TPA: carboxylesterase family protein [Caulobacteraceae bacterium]|nr:carboxylesterase family protein [Caulobacteraceae bacterium]
MKIFRGIRYARAERFGQPELAAFAEAEISKDRGPISPQRPSRLELAMGPLPPNRQDEHCQVLSVFTPSRTGRRPVMVFLHGGAFVSGGGELAWYDGDKLAAEQDVVVVPVTYRLGALGYLLTPGGTGLSPGMSDQLIALRWVKANIAAFGGDPDNVTVFGQSAGGMSILALLAWGHGGVLFKRAIVQSGPFPLGARANCEAASKAYLDLLKGDPHAVPVEDLIAAQVQLTVARGGDPGWVPVAPDKIAAANVPVMVGWTREDGSPFALIAEHRLPTPDVDLALYQPATARFKDGTLKVASAAAAAGQKAYLYRFAWDGPKTGLGDCHTIELPFLLGSEAAWKDAPMLAGAAWGEIEANGRKMRAVWASFARSGDPGLIGGAQWPAVTTTEQPVVDLPPI